MGVVPRRVIMAGEAMWQAPGKRQVSGRKHRSRASRPEASEIIYPSAVGGASMSAKLPSKIGWRDLDKLALPVLERPTVVSKGGRVLCGPSAIPAAAPTRRAASGRPASAPQVRTLSGRVLQGPTPSPASSAVAPEAAGGVVVPVRPPRAVSRSGRVLVGPSFAVAAPSPVPVGTRAGAGMGVGMPMRQVSASGRVLVGPTPLPGASPAPRAPWLARSQSASSARPATADPGLSRSLSLARGQIKLSGQDRQVAVGPGGRVLMGPWGGAFAGAPPAKLSPSKGTVVFADTSGVVYKKPMPLPAAATRNNVVPRSAAPRPRPDAPTRVAVKVRRAPAGAGREASAAARVCILAELAERQSKRDATRARKDASASSAKLGAGGKGGAGGRAAGRNRALRASGQVHQPRATTGAGGRN
mmetsp:Transcript_62378/g.197598  ORF Transcript_62378/g.197598 Transcript_62378/m.197598 type:complete len:415 (+) Transcript_62378:947-2191(+)